MKAHITYIMAFVNIFGYIFPISNYLLYLTIFAIICHKVCDSYHSPEKSPQVPQCFHKPRRVFHNLTKVFHKEARYDRVS